MEHGPQTVPCSLFDSRTAVSSYVPDFDVFLRDSEVPSPSNIYGNSFFVDSPDYSMLASNMDDLMYSQFPMSPEPAAAKQYMKMRSAVVQDPSAKDFESDLQLEDFTTALLASAEEATHLELFASTFINGGVAIKKEVEESHFATSHCAGGHHAAAEEEAAAAANENDCISAADGDVRGMQQQQHVCIKSEVLEDEDSVMCEDFEKVQTLVMQQLTEDIEVACKTLRISPDPATWSVQNVHAWLLWTLRQYNLPQIPLDYFIMDGPALCSLSEDNFRQLMAQHGDILCAQLEIWKTAASFKKERPDTPPIHAPSPDPSACVPNAFKPDDSMLDSYLQWNTAAAMLNSPRSVRDRSVSPDQSLVACVPDIGNGTAANHGSDYASSDGGFQSDDDASEDSLDIDKPTRQGSHAHIHLWQFLKELLLHPQPYSTCIRWLDRSRGVFKIEDSVRVAKLWGKRKNRPAMNYDKLSRSIRQYYKKGIMKKTERSQRLVYQFCHPYCL